MRITTILLMDFQVLQKLANCRTVHNSIPLDSEWSMITIAGSKFFFFAQTESVSLQIKFTFTGEGVFFAENDHARGHCRTWALDQEHIYNVLPPQKKNKCKTFYPLPFFTPLDLVLHLPKPWYIVMILCDVILL